MNRVITIGREFGSGGRELGKRLADLLGCAYYDKEIIAEISKKTSLSEEYIQEVVEKRPHNLYPITIGQSLRYANTYHVNQVQTVFQAQCEILKSLAEKSNCVIVGRCSNYILKDIVYTVKTDETGAVSIIDSNEKDSDGNKINLEDSEWFEVMQNGITCIYNEYKYSEWNF